MSQQVNLILPGLRPTLDPLSLPVVAAVAAVIVLSLAGLASWEGVANEKLKTEKTVKSAEIAALRQQIEVLGQALSKRETNPGLGLEIEKVRLDVAQRREAFDALTSTSLAGQSYAGVFQGFSAQAVAGVWLTGFRVFGDEVEIQGRLTDSAGLPAYIARLNQAPVFAGRRFAALDMQSGPVDTDAEAAVSVEAVRPSRLRYTEFTLRSSLTSQEDMAR